MAAGHRIVPHTADLALEAWAPGKGECIAEAARALVGSFADVRGAVPRETVTVELAEASDEDLLVRALDEVIYQLEVHRRVPAAIWVAVADAGDPAGTAGTEGTEGPATIRLAAVPAADVRVTGAIPKAVTRHELRFGRSGGLWRCRVIVDV